MDSANSTRAAGIAIAALKELWSIPTASQVHSQHVFQLKTIFNGLRDVANLATVVRHDGWIENHEAVESVWSLTHDAMSRLEDQSGLDASFIELYLRDAARALSEISNRYGKGIYASPEILYDEFLCSICNADARACDHLPGHWYESQLCRFHVGKSQIVAIALVEHPKDPRCRMWPWNKKQDERDGKNIFTMPVYIIFTPEGDSEGGKVVKPSELFGRRRVKAS